MLENIRIKVPDTVYAPLEDSQLLANAALQECEGKILEVGCGSGYVGIALAKLKKDVEIFAVDINPDAVKAAQKNAKVNGVKIEVKQSDLFEKIEDKYDWILFNPPYLPTSEAEKLEGGLNLAFDGGKSGLDTAFKFLENLKAHLKNEGKCLMVASTEQDLVKLNEKIRECGFEYKIIAEEAFFFEKIYVYKLTIT